MRNPAPFAIAAALLAALGCDRPSPAPGGGAAPSVQFRDDFVFAPVERAHELPPPRFAALPPRAPEVFARPIWDHRYPPKAHLQHGLAMGNGRAFAGLAYSIDEAVADGASLETVRRAHGAMVRHLGTERFCEGARAVAAAPQYTPEVRAVMRHGLIGCPIEYVSDATIAAAEPNTRVALYRRRIDELGIAPSTPPPGDLRAALRAILAEPLGPMHGDAARAVEDHAGGADHLLELHGSLEPELRDRLELALRHARDPRLVALFTARCQRAAHALCEGGPSPASAPGPYGRPLARLVTDWGFDPVRYLRRAPAQRSALVAELVECSELTGDPPCLAHLARIDYRRARALALAMEPDPRSPNWPVVDALRRCRTAAEIAAPLVEVGLLARAPAEGDVTVEAILSRAGRLYRFDTETNTFPNHHDSLLRALLALGPTALQGALFEEEPPSFTDDPERGELVIADEPYTLTAHLDGQRFTTTARNEDDWLDVAAVVGLLNVLARARGSDTRWRQLPSDGQAAIVIAGPGAAIQRAERRGLFDGIR